MAATSPLDHDISDRSWVRQTFMLSTAGFDNAATNWSVFTEASMAYTSTQLGANWAINCPPARTRYADLKVKSRVSTLQFTYPQDKDGQQRMAMDQAASGGIGRHYFEAIDKNSQLVHFQIGLPKFQGMTTFFTSFYNSGMGLMANEGRRGFFFGLGKIVGFIGTLPLWPILMIGRLYKFALDIPTSMYYYCEPKMHLYWQRVNMMANDLAVKMGITGRVFDSPFGANLDGLDAGQNQQVLDWMHTHNPGLIRKDGTIDIYAMANRAQDMANRRYKYLSDRMNESNAGTDKGLRDELLRYMTEAKIQPATDGKGGVTLEAGLAKYLEWYYGYSKGDSTGKEWQTGETGLTEEWKAQQKQAADTKAADAKASISGSLSEQEPAATLAGDDPKDTSLTGGRAVWGEVKDPATLENGLSWWSWPAKLLGGDALRQAIENEATEGSQMVTFRVDATGAVNESFSNSFQESGIASTINGASGNARSAHFNFSGGNTGIGVLDSAIGAIGDFGRGILQSVQMSGLISLAGSAYVDIPQVWANSSANLPSQSYTIQLRSVYGNKVNRYMYMYVPMLMVLAAGLPISTGAQSYTAPFVMKAYSRGRVTSRLCMIDSIQISRGEGNMGWNNQNEPLGIDITFTVKDLSGIMHVPIEIPYNPLELGNLVSNILDNDNSYSDYMSALASLSIADQTQVMRKLSLNLARAKTGFNSYFTRTHFANWWSGTFPGQVIRAMSRESDRLSL